MKSLQEKLLIERNAELEKELAVKNRELEIEAALEKVRSRTLAMHKSDEHKEIAMVVFEKLQELGVASDGGAAINIFTEGSKDFIQWIAAPGYISSARYFFLPYSDTLILKEFWEARESGLDFFSKAYNFEEKNVFLKYIFEYSDYKYLPDEIKVALLATENYMYSHAFSKHSGIFINRYNGIPITEKENDIIKRFARVVEQAYIRFLDLHKAEEQTREAQIETALERVRSRTMAMYKSNELADVAATVFHQLQNLGITDLRRSLLGIMNEEENIWRCWYTTVEGESFASLLDMPADGHPVASEMKISWREKKMIHVELTGETLKSWIQFILASGWQYPKGEAPPAQKFVIYGLPFSHGYLIAFTNENILPAEVGLLKRFARVFDQTYTRFLDLQKAEAQAREAKIEAGLERVRSRTMAMQKSGELVETAAVFFKQLISLGVTPNRLYIGIIKDESGNIDMWATDEEGTKIATQFTGNINRSVIIDAMYKGWAAQKKSITIDIQGKELSDYFHYLGEELKVTFKQGFSQKRRVQTVAYFAKGFIGIASPDTQPQETTNLLERFAAVFNLAYTRFNDLQIAEAQAREAKIEAALESVRSKAMAMQKSEDLADAVAIVFEELDKLKMGTTRCGISIIHKEKRSTDVWSAIKGEKGTTVQVTGDESMDIHPLLQGAFDAWLKQDDYSYLLQGEDLDRFYKALAATNFKLPDSPVNEKMQQFLYVAHFPAGGLYVFRETEFEDEAKIVIRRFAEVFNLTYTRFNDLKQAEQLALQAQIDLVNLKAEKKKTEDALTELKAAQHQLIQSEKMASLGELTAGIAHEIQNPLNFVNNFSEVNKELIGEMKAEIDKGNMEEVKAIADDIESNEEKINQHGKRADAIVKGMLQHSRSSSATKEPTDINKLADEYIRLCYHGLRAKDKSFNATIKTDFDDTIGKINIMPQDIGRVILNLLTNAFYAANEKKKQVEQNLIGLDQYEPTVSVSTKKMDDKVFIAVKDNGNGIPQKVLDKIFQPFFTTKPTGQGTGLGLSLSYDIIKAHGGELKVETKEGEGAEFIVHLAAH
ncbi:MAG: ATP-binding protein [Ferruginibacter sp.]